MPHLKLFKRTWKYSDDEFVIPCICQAILRILLGSISAVYILSNTSWLNERNPINEAIFILMAVFCGSHIFVYIIVAFMSGRGGPMEIHKRISVSTWVIIHLVNLFCEVLFCCISIWKIRELHTNNSEIVTIQNFAAVVSWCSILLCAAVFEIIDWIRHHDPNGNFKYTFYNTFLYGKGGEKTESEKKDLIKEMHQISRKKFVKLIRDKLTSYDVFDDDGKEEAITGVATVLADFVGDLDLTTSDVVMGLLLLRWQTQQWIGGKSRVLSSTVLEQTEAVIDDIAAPLVTISEDPSVRLQNNWLHISRLKRYSHLVNASYGWLYYYTQNVCDCFAIGRLLKKLSLKNPEANPKQIDLENGIQGPGGCLCAGTNCYLSAFLEMTELKCEDILVFEIADKFYEAAIMMVIDDATEAIVIIVRGTLSGDDTLVDMMAIGEPLRPEDLDAPAESQFIAHSGMVRVARNLSRRIVDENWVQEARTRRPAYPVVLCGHSLGAGLVSLMAVLMKPQFPDLKAYAFSPPGALMNENMAAHSRDFLVSMIYGYDCVGRLGGQTLEDLRARLFHALCVFKVPKFTALSNRILVFLLRALPRCTFLPNIGRMDQHLNIETREKLIDPHLDDAFETPIGSNLKPHQRDRMYCCTHTDRLLPGQRSLMKWKRPQCDRLLVLPRPYPKRLWPKGYREPKSKNVYSVDLMLETLQRPVASGRILHILEVDGDFAVQGVQPYKKAGYKPPPIAVWADQNTFNSVLVHPKALLNHNPIFVSTAIDRLYNSIMHPEQIFPKIHINTWPSDGNPLKNKKRDPAELVDEFCRIRKFK